MLSIAKMKGAGQGDYYMNLAREDYYLEGGEPPGIWEGKGASVLGLEGTVTRSILENLLEGYSPDGAKALRQNAGVKEETEDGRKAQAGWDLTFSAPKSVSTYWSQADKETRSEIQAAQREAVGKALGYLEANASFTRRGKGGRETEKADIAVATFEHGTSRAQDPQLHTHALLMNVGVRKDGTTGTLDTREIYKSKMVAGALYRAELSKQLEKRLGLESERTRSWFELKGVSKELTGEFSKRRKEVEKKLAETGFEGGKAAKIAALDTRTSKEHTPRDVLLKEWQKTGKEFGFSLRDAEHLKGKAQARNPEKEQREAINEAVNKITEGNSFFSERDLVRHTAEAAQGRGIGADEIQAVVTKALKESKNIVSLGRKDGELKYTTREMLELEKKLLTRTDSMKEKRGYNASSRAIDNAIKNRPSISEEQKKALTHITKGDGLAVVSGMAGTGKSFMLGAVRDAYEASGYSVHGAALSGKAAKGLEEGSGIKSDTVHKTIYDLEAGRLQLNRQSVVVVDEAGMLGTRKLEELTRHIEKKGAKLVLIGDAGQLQPIEAGGTFREIGKRAGEERLTDIRRQGDSWAREAVKDFASGRAKEGLKAYADRGLLTVSETPKDARDTLVKDWSKEGVAAPKENLILAGTNKDVAILNEEAQAFRFKEGALGDKSQNIQGTEVFTGDRVVFTQNDRKLGVKNGDFADVVDTSPNKMTVKKDDGSTLTVNLKEYNNIKLGYAVTTHKAQGMTASNAYVLAGGVMQDRELSYVQMSRAKDKTRVYTDKVEAGENLTELARKMEKSRAKDLAMTVLRREQERNGIRR